MIAEASVLGLWIFCGLVCVANSIKDRKGK
jgi:hypothetical protein